MKDKLNGNIIQEAYFLGIKQYGYKYTDKNTNKIIEKAVFVAGVKRNSLKFYDLRDLSNGLVKDILFESRFFTSLKDLTIKVKPIIIKIKQNNLKPLINNHYKPLTINNDKIINSSKIKYLHNIKAFIKKYL